MIPLLCMALSAALGYWLAKRKKRNEVGWTVLSFFFPFFVPAFLWLFVRTKLQSLEEYLAQYPNSRSEQGLSCAFCGSSSIRAIGVRDPTDRHMMHVCNHCGAALYET